MKTTTFIDLFAGIGGFRLGIENAAKKLQIPVKCVFSSEIEKNAVKIYEKNFNETPIGDITKIQATDIPDFDILCGGFPCQPFSIAGKRKGFDDDRGDLFFEIMRIALEKQPNILFLENVKGLLSSKVEIPSYYAVKLLNDEILGGTLWEENFTPKNNWKEFENYIQLFIQEILQMNSESPKKEFVTSSTTYSKFRLEKKENSVGSTLLKNLKFLGTQLLQIMKNTNCFPKELMDQLEERVVVLNLNLKRLFSTGSLLIWDTHWLDLTVLTLGEIEKSCRKSLEENYLMMNMFTTSTETNQTTDLKICTYVQKINITLFIIKHWILSTTFWKRVLLNLTGKTENMYYVRTFNIILQTIHECGYDVEWQVLNSKDFGVPQNRERVFIIGHLTTSRRCGSKIFPIIRTDDEIHDEPKKREFGTEKYTVYPFLTPKRVVTRQNGRRMKNPDEPMFTLTAQDRHGILIQEYHSPHQQDRIIDPRGISSCLPTGTGGQLVPKIRQNDIIRMLTPIECERLQGYPDRYTEGISDSMRYKCLGNSVTVNVIQAIAEKLLCVVSKEDQIEKET